MKSFIATLLLLWAVQVNADGFSVNEKRAFLSKMPDMLREYNEDEAIKACIQRARQGYDDSFVALVVIAHAKQVMDEHTEKMSEAVTASKNRDEIYERSKAIYQSSNLRKNMKLLLGMPKAIKHCNSLVGGQQ